MDAHRSYRGQQVIRCNRFGELNGHSIQVASKLDEWTTFDTVDAAFVDSVSLTGFLSINETRSIATSELRKVPERRACGIIEANCQVTPRQSFSTPTRLPVHMQESATKIPPSKTSLAKLSDRNRRSSTMPIHYLTLAT